MFMPDNPSKDFIKRAQLFITDDDESAKSNKQRWNFIESTFDQEGCTLFSQIDYADILNKGVFSYVHGALTMADMRAEFLQEELDRDDKSSALHQMFLRNLIWATRFKFFIEVNSIPDNNRKVIYQ
jgi:hypothetical protein